MAAPRLLAIAPDAWYAADDFSTQLAVFRRKTEILGDSVAVYLRAHGWSTAEWLERLDELPRPRKLRIGITFPVDAELPEASEQLTDAGVDFVHLTERDADRPMQAWQPLQLSRVCHDPQDARRRLQLGADWLVFSPVFATPSKPNAAPHGLAGLAEAAHAAPGRIVALGGVDAEAVGQCCAAGAVGVAAQRAAWTNAAALAAAVAGA